MGTIGKQKIALDAYIKRAELTLDVNDYNSIDWLELVKVLYDHGVEVKEFEVKPAIYEVGDEIEFVTGIINPLKYCYRIAMPGEFKTKYIIYITLEVISEAPLKQKEFDEVLHLIRLAILEDE